DARARGAWQPTRRGTRRDTHDGARAGGARRVGNAARFACAACTAGKCVAARLADRGRAGAFELSGRVPYATRASNAAGRDGAKRGGGIARNARGTRKAGRGISRYAALISGGADGIRDSRRLPARATRAQSYRARLRRVRVERHGGMDGYG